MAFSGVFCTACRVLLNGWMRIDFHLAFTRFIRVLLACCSHSRLSLRVMGGGGGIREMLLVELMDLRGCLSLTSCTGRELAILRSSRLLLAWIARVRVMLGSTTVVRRPKRERRGNRQVERVQAG